MNTVAELALSALSERGISGLSIYQRELDRATGIHPPPFGEAWYGERYRSLAIDPAWMASSLVANAKKEGEGAVTLWKLAGAITEREVAAQVRDHALDEARHARLYLGMLQQVFEGWNAVTRRALKQIPPSLSGDPVPQPPRSEEVVYDEIIQMNIGEVRTMIHQRMLQPVLCAWCPPSAQNRVQRVLDVVLEDEVRHIAYTASLIDRYGARGNEAFVATTMERRVADFNAYTLKEVGQPPDMV